MKIMTAPLADHSYITDLPRCFSAKYLIAKDDEIIGESNVCDFDTPDHIYSTDKCSAEEEQMVLEYAIKQGAAKKIKAYVVQADYTKKRATIFELSIEDSEEAARQAMIDYWDRLSAYDRKHCDGIFTEMYIVDGFAEDTAKTAYDRAVDMDVDTLTIGCPDDYIEMKLLSSDEWAAAHQLGNLYVLALGGHASDLDFERAADALVCTLFDLDGASDPNDYRAIGRVLCQFAGIESEYDDASDDDEADKIVDRAAELIGIEMEY